MTILPLALSYRKGQVGLYPSGAASRIDLGSPRNVLVRMTTIDLLFPDTAITYMKVDVEGCELQLLQGAKQTIRKWRPKIAIAAYHRDEDAEMLTKFLLDLNLGYKTLLKGIFPRGGRPMLLHAWAE
jgi:hypothetical protein